MSLEYWAQYLGRRIDMKPTKKIALSYGLKKASSNEINKLLNLFSAKNIFIEIINISSKSDFYNSINNSDIEYMSSSVSNKVDKPYIDIFIFSYLEENFLCMIDRIIESKPEELIFYCTNLSTEQFLDIQKSINMLIKQQLSDCVLEFMFDENVLSISYNPEQYNQQNMSALVSNILCFGGGSQVYIPKVKTSWIIKK